MNPIRIRLRYVDLDTFVERFAPNVTRGGIFLASQNIQAVGAVIPFEVQLRGGEVMLAGEGRVTWVKAFNPAEPKRPYGMGVQFLTVDAATRPILARILRAKELNGQGRRPTTGPLVPVGGAVSGATYVSGQPSLTNGKSGAVAIDTSVDLAAEYGLDDQSVRRMIERTWMTGARGSDDLADLLRPDPPETVTLQQALAELPRLLDPQSSRRRASSSFRPLEGRVAGGGSGRVVAGPSDGETARAAPETTAVEQPITDETPVVLSPGEPAEAGDDGPTVVRPTVVSATDVRPTDVRATADGIIDARTSDLSDTTDMTGDGDTVAVMRAVPAEELAAAAVVGNGRRGKHNRR